MTTHDEDQPQSDRPLAYRLGRRRFLLALIAAPFAGLWALTHAPQAGAMILLAPTPAIPDDDDDEIEPTHSATAGPFFKPKSPERVSLIEPGLPGTPLTVSGRVRGRDGKPVAGALLDFWQADDAGEYDNSGFRLRGHQHADAQGRYRLATIVPGQYPGRTRHIHVKVQAPRGKVLTTQMYFPGEARNASDGLFDEALIVAVREEGKARAGTFDFVLADR